MNIESKLRLLRKAKKRRVALPFHSRHVGGIDVEPDEFNDALAFIKKLFKQLKANKFDIKINHWGEVILVEPQRNIEVFLSIKHALNNSQISKVKRLLNGNDYCQVAGSINKAIEVAFKANRQGTKWRSVELPNEVENHAEVATKSTDYIIESVSGLTNTGRPQYHTPIDKFNSEDILCIMNYGAVLYGPNSQFAHLLSNPKHSFLTNLSIKGDYLTVGNSFGRGTEFLLNKQSKKLLAKFFTLPETDVDINN